MFSKTGIYISSTLRYFTPLVNILFMLSLLTSVLLLCLSAGSTSQRSPVGVKPKITLDPYTRLKSDKLDLVSRLVRYKHTCVLLFAGVDFPREGEERDPLIVGTHPLDPTVPQCTAHSETLSLTGTWSCRGVTAPQCSETTYSGWSSSNPWGVFTEELLD